MITGIILASGLSRRMKKDKLLIEVGGKAIIEYVLEACAASRLDRLILVYRSQAVKVISEKYKLDIIYNPNPRLGQSQAMKLGLSLVEDGSAFMFLMGDQPFITSDLIDKLILEYKKEKLPLLVPYYNGSRGMPSIFAYEYKQELMAVKGDLGGREILKRDASKLHRIDISDPKMGMDIDTLEDLEKVKKWIR